MSASPLSEPDPRELALRSGLDALALITSDAAVQSAACVPRSSGQMESCVQPQRGPRLAAGGAPTSARLSGRLAGAGSAFAARRSEAARCGQRRRIAGGGPGDHAPQVVGPLRRRRRQEDQLHPTCRRRVGIEESGRRSTAVSKHFRRNPATSSSPGPLLPWRTSPRLTRRHLAPDGCWMAMKGRQPDDEIAALPDGVEVFHVEHLRVPGLPAERCLVWMRPKVNDATMVSSDLPAAAKRVGVNLG